MKEQSKPQSEENGRSPSVAAWPEDTEPRWLDERELRSWMAMARMLTTLSSALERDLGRYANLNWMEYHALAMLSEQEGHTVRMSELAALTDASLSRLSHLAKRLEGRGFMRREPDPEDGRFTVAILTPTGYDTLAAAAPWHVESVRRLVFDAVGSDAMDRLRPIFDRVNDAVENHGPLTPPCERTDPAP